MNLSSYIKQSSEYKPLEYLLTLPPMSKIKGISERTHFEFKAIGAKGLYELYFNPKNEIYNIDLTIKELIKFVSMYSSQQKYKFEIEFEQEESNIDIETEAISLRKIYERTKNPLLLNKIKELEPEIAKNAERAYWYARDINERFPLGELKIAQSPGWSYEYAKDVIKGRFPLGESAISKTEFYARKYCERFSLKLINSKFYDKKELI